MEPEARPTVLQPWGRRPGPRDGAAVRGRWPPKPLCHRRFSRVQETEGFRGLAPVVAPLTADGGHCHRAGVVQERSGRETRGARIPGEPAGGF